MNLSNESTFKTVFVVLWAVNFFTRAYFQMKARGAQRASSKNERNARLGFRMLAIVYLVLILYSLTSWFDFAHLEFSDGLRWGGGLFFLMIYFILFVSCHVILGKHWSPLVEIHQDHVLMTTGPYRFVRHPMYLSFFLSSVGIFVLTANWLLFALYTLSVLFMYVARVGSEEEIMVEKFGDEYRDYMRRTGRLLPKWITNK